MAILKYYKVGSDGKIQRLRRECKCQLLYAESRLTPRPRSYLRCWCLHGLAQGPTGLRKVWTHLHFRAWNQAHRCLSGEPLASPFWMNNRERSMLRNHSVVCDATVYSLPTPCHCFLTKSIRPERSEMALLQEPNLPQSFDRIPILSGQGDNMYSYFSTTECV